MKLQKCNPEYNVVLAQIHVIRENEAEGGQLESVALDAAQDNDWMIRIDNPLDQVFMDENDKEVCIFVAHDDNGEHIQITPQKTGVIEIC